MKFLNFKKTFILIFICGWVAPAILYANPRLEQDVEGEPAPVVIEPKSNLEVQEQEVQIAVAIAEGESRPISIETKRGSQFEFPYILDGEYYHPLDYLRSVPISFKSAYAKLSDADKVRFQENRLFFLTRAATILDRSQLVIGFGSLIKNKIVQIRSFFKKKNPIDETAKELLPEEKQTKSNIRLYSHKIITELLKEIDEQMWAGANIVAKQNEFVVSAALNFLLEGGAGAKGWGGSAGIGINLGFNRDTKAIVFEIFTEVDRFRWAITPFFLTGINPKFGFLMYDQNQESESSLREGVSFYPPVVPGVFMSTSNSMMMGINTSILSFPPLIGDAFSYLNVTSRRPILRVSITHLNKKFIRVQTGLADGAKASFESVTGAFNEVANYIKKASNKCMKALQQDYFD